MIADARARRDPGVQPLDRTAFELERELQLLGNRLTRGSGTPTWSAFSVRVSAPLVAARQLAQQCARDRRTDLALHGEAMTHTHDEEAGAVVFDHPHAVDPAQPRKGGAYLVGSGRLHAVGPRIVGSVSEGAYPRLRAASPEVGKCRGRRPGTGLRFPSPALHECAGHGKDAALNGRLDGDRSNGPSRVYRADSTPRAGLASLGKGTERRASSESRPPSRAGIARRPRAKRDPSGASAPVWRLLRGGDRVRGVPQVVEAEAGRKPAAWRAAVQCFASTWRRSGPPRSPGKDPVARARAAEARQVLLELLGQERRQHERAHACVALGRPEHELAVCHLLLLLFDGDRLVQQVDVASLQAEQLAHAQPDEARDEHEHAVSVADAFGDRPDLIGGRDRAFSCALDAGTADDARIAKDQLVGDGRRKDRAQKSVALRRRVRAETGSARETGVPLAHRFRRELGQLDLRRASGRTCASSWCSYSSCVRGRRLVLCASHSLAYCSSVVRPARGSTHWPRSRSASTVFAKRSASRRVRSVLVRTPPAGVR